MDYDFCEQKYSAGTNFIAYVIAFAIIIGFVFLIAILIPMFVFWDLSLLFTFWKPILRLYAAIVIILAIPAWLFKVFD